MKILYEDNHILAIFKPAGLLVQGDRSGEPSLFEIARGYLKEKYKKPGRVYLGLVHRIDRPVAGVVIFAKTSKASSRICREFREHKVKKIYWAVVQGVMRGSGVLNHILLRDRKKGISRIIDKMVRGAQEVKLSYRVIKNRNGCTLLEIIPATGRHHQIRAQLGAFGYPILGDTLYGATENLADGIIALLGREICFCHPVKKEDITIRAPTPSYFPI